MMRLEVIRLMNENIQSYLLKGDKSKGVFDFRGVWANLRKISTKFQ
jgi:hypothetical protein